MKTRLLGEGRIVKVFDRRFDVVLDGASEIETIPVPIWSRKDWMDVVGTRVRISYCSTPSLGYHSAEKI